MCADRVDVLNGLVADIWDILLFYICNVNSEWHKSETRSRTGPDSFCTPLKEGVPHIENKTPQIRRTHAVSYLKINQIDLGNELNLYKFRVIVLLRDC